MLLGDRFWPDTCLALVYERLYFGGYLRAVVPLSQVIQKLCGPRVSLRDVFVKCPDYVHHELFWDYCWLVKNFTCVVKVLQKILLTTSGSLIFLWNFWKNWLSKITCVGAAPCSKSIALDFCTSPLFSCKTCNLSALDGVTLFNARGGKEPVLTNLTKVICNLSAMFCDIQCRRALSFGGHQFLSLWGALAHFLCFWWFVGRCVRRMFLDVFISLVVRVVTSFVSFLLWRLGGDVNIDLKHWKKIG